MVPSPNSNQDVQASGPIARRQHKKSRYGCKACKERKIKCDEKRPVCRNCERHFINVDACEYPENATPGDRSSRALRPTNSREDPVESSENSNASGPLSICIVAGGSLDPFETHPTSTTPEPDVNKLMDHYFKSCVFNMFPYYPTADINPVTEYFAPLVWTDTVLFHVALQLSAYHLEKITVARDNSQSSRLMTDCLKLLQARVHCSPEISLSDETIAAVAGLAAIEFEKGNMRMVETHMRGLRRMLDLRGGISAIRLSNPTIANIVFCMFIAAVDHPFPDIDLEIPISRPPWFEDARRRLDPQFYVDFLTCGVEPAYTETMVNIRLLAKCYQTAADCSSAEEYQSVLTFLCSTLQRLLSLPMPVMSLDNNLEAVYVTQACRHALIVHVFAQWSGHQPDPALMVSNARHELQTTCRTLMNLGSRNPLLLWLMAVGGVGALGTPERKWFVGHMAVLMSAFGISTWQELRDALKRIIWHEFQDEATHRVLWEEIALILDRSDNATEMER